MEITRELVAGIGLRQFSSQQENPQYYGFRNTPYDERFLIRLKDGEWELCQDNGDCGEFKRKLTSLEDLVRAFTRHHFLSGRNSLRRDLAMPETFFPK